MNFKISFNTACGGGKKKAAEAKDITKTEINKHFFYYNLEL